MKLTASGMAVWTATLGFGSALNGGQLRFYSGPEIASNAPGGSNALLATAQLDDPAFSADGTLVTVDDPTVAVAGVPSSATLVTAGGVVLAVLTVAGRAGLADIVVNDGTVPGATSTTATLTVGQTFEIVARMPAFTVRGMLLAEADGLTPVPGVAGDAVFVKRGGETILVDVCPPIDGQSVLIDAGTVLDAGTDAFLAGDQVLAYRAARTIASCATTTGSTSITVPSTTGLRHGQGVSGPGIPPGAWIDTVGVGSITISANASAAGTVTLTFDKIIALYPFDGLGGSGAVLDNDGLSFDSVWSSLKTLQVINGTLYAQTIFTEAGTTFATSGTDSGSGRLVKFTSSSPISVTLDDIPVAQTAEFLVAGTGRATFSFASGTILAGGKSPVSAFQGARIWAQRLDASTVHLWGDLTGSSATVVIPITIGADTTAVAAATNIGQFRMPVGFVCTKVKAHLITAGATLTTIDINQGVGGTTMLSTKLTIDGGELTSDTAATPAVISSPSVSEDVVVSIDCDGAGAGAAGLRVYLIGYWA